MKFNFILKFFLFVIFIAIAVVGFAQTELPQTKIDPEKHKIINSNRPDGRYVSTRGYVQYLMRNIQHQLAFDPMFSKDEFIEWQSKVRDKMQELMKFPSVVPPQPPPKLLNKVERNGYTVERWEHYPQPGSVVPFLMLVPDGVSDENPAPAVLCFPGTHRSKESLAGEEELHPRYAVERYNSENRIAMFYVQQGIVAIAVDNPGFVETSDLRTYDFNTFTQYLLNMDWHYMGLFVFQNHQLLKWVRTRNFINSKKIALSGHSLGAWPAPYLAVLNPDIEAVVYNQCIYRWLEAAKARTKPDSTGVRPSGFGLFYVIPGMYNWFDNPDIIASLAPRPFLFTEGGSIPDYELIKCAYKIMDAEDKLSLFHYPKFRNPENRYYGYLPEGVNNYEFWKYLNTDPPDHYFKADIAVPWLRKVLKNKQ